MQSSLHRASVKLESTDAEIIISAAQRCACAGSSVSMEAPAICLSLQTETFPLAKVDTMEPLVERNASLLEAGEMSSRATIITDPTALRV